MTVEVTNLTEWRAAHQPAAQPIMAGDWHQATAVPIPAADQAAGPAYVWVAIFEDGPWVNWLGRDPTELQVMALALMDAARAARNGDDLNEVARQEWTRRGGRPEPD